MPSSQESEVRSEVPQKGHIAGWDINSSLSGQSAATMVLEEIYFV
jgi:hypothetical protein